MEIPRADTRWHHVAWTEERVSLTSRFLTGEASITRGELEEEWPRWTPVERHDFVFAFAASRRPDEDLEVMDFLLQTAEAAGPEEIRLYRGSLLPRHRDRERVFSLLMRWHAFKPQAVTEALGLLGDRRAVPALEGQLQAALAAPGLETGWLDEGAADAIATLSALIRLQPEREDLVATLQGFERHAHPDVARHARAMLEQARRDPGPFRPRTEGGDVPAGT